MEKNFTFHRGRCSLEAVFPFPWKTFLMTGQQLEEAIFFVKMKECQVKVDESKRPCISVYLSRTLIITLFLNPFNPFCFCCLKNNAIEFYKHCTVCINENSSEKETRGLPTMT